jgi:hypothetical protein
MKKDFFLLLVAYAVLFVCSGIGFAAPYVIDIDWTSGGITQPIYHVGVLLGDKGDEKWTAGIVWCDGLTYSDCTALKISWLIAAILWALSLIFIVVTVICLFKAPLAAFFVCPLGFFCHASGAFTFAFRVPQLFRENLQQNSATTAVNWTLNWAGIIAVISVGIHFITTLIFGILFPSICTIAGESSHEEKPEESIGDREDRENREAHETS